MIKFIRWNTVFKNLISSCQLVFYYRKNVIDVDKNFDILEDIFGGHVGLII